MTECISDYLSYKDGELFWVKVPKHFQKASVGDVAGWSHHSGYKYVKVAGKVYAQHRVVWYLNHGSWPEEEVDHIDGDKSNNRIQNLRLANRSQNAANIKRSGGTSTFNGVSWKTRDRRWIVQVAGKHIGSYICEKEAALAYNHKAAEHFGSYAWFNKVFEDV